MKYITTGIDIGSHTTRLCVIEHDSKEKKSEVVGFTKIPMQGMHHGHVHNAENVQKTVEKLLKETNKLFETTAESIFVSNSLFVSFSSFSTVFCTFSAL